MVRFVILSIIMISLLILVAMSGAMWFSSHDRVIAYTSGNSRVHNLHLTDVDHALTVTYAIETRYLFGVDWSPTGDRLLVIKLNPTTDGVDIQMMVDGRWQSFPFDQIQEEAFSWSPDEQYIVYTDNAGNESAYDLYQVDRTGQNVQRLFEREGGEWYPTFSPDGRWIAFHSIVNTPEQSIQNAMLYNVETGEIQSIHPYDNETTDSFSVSWSPDSQQIAYTIRLPDRQVAIAIRDIAEGTTRLLLPDAQYDYFTPEWSADGQYIAFRTANRSYVVDVDGENLTPIDSADNPLEALKWSGDGAYLSGVGKAGLGLITERSNILYVLDATQLSKPPRRVFNGVLTSVPIWQP